MMPHRVLNAARQGSELFVRQRFAGAVDGRFDVFFVEPRQVRATGDGAGRDIGSSGRSCG
jgi:hypothetical protein